MPSRPHTRRGGTRRHLGVYILWSRAWFTVGSLLLAAGCAAPSMPAAGVRSNVAISLLYPRSDTSVEMGQEVGFLLEAGEPGEAPSMGSRLSVRLRDPKGRLSTVLPAEAGAGGVYRTQPWRIPHRVEAGTWTVEAKAEGSESGATVIGRFDVYESISEVLLRKYGWWIDPPSFHGITPELVAEKGDARNGMIRVGGAAPAQHMLPEEWIEIHWRQGDFGVRDSSSARRFMLEEVGDFGFTRVRELGAFQEVRFKNWTAWSAKARGELSSTQIEWIVFSPPETGQTLAIGTTLALPPAGVDAHALFRESFELHPDEGAYASAATPLPRLLPAPELIDPPLGTAFRGSESPVILRWSPVRELAVGEYYEVDVDYNYREGNFPLRLVTRATQVTLPEDLYQMPNCRIFNWQVTLMKVIDTAADGNPVGVPLSYRSFYGYIEWTYPATETQPFPPLCPNEQV